MPLALRLFFKKIFINNKHNIPRKGPVILASMHPNSFIDDFVLGVFSGRNLRFLARGDVFKTSVARFFLNQMNVSPVYRAMDNSRDVKKNLDAFNVYTRTLKKGGTLLIHSEGICVHEKRVRPLKKGTVKIAFGAEEANDFNLGIRIVPISLNYTNASCIREDLMIECAEPILVSDYKDLYLENPARAYNELNKAIFSALQKGAVIEEKGTEDVAEHCLLLARNNHPLTILPIAEKNNSRFALEKQVCDNINTLFAESKEKFSKLERLCNDYFIQLKKNNITDRDLAANRNDLFLHWFGLFLLSPIFLLGYLINAWPVMIARKLAEKVCKTVEFYASVFVGTSWLLFLIQYLILFIVFSVLFGLIGFIAVCGAALTGFLSVFIRDQFIVAKAKFRFVSFKKKHPQWVDELRAKREKILEIVQFQ
nr:1-acyl-sn-glycerol-3-phosphate acyltransferase [uncultured Carboxylicivirga sp.]